MRLKLRMLAFIDVISLVFLTLQLLTILQSFNQQPIVWQKIVKTMLMSILFLSFFVLIYGQLCYKKFALITYYIQFPIRLILWIFSIGFITLIPEMMSDFSDKWVSLLFTTCVIAEFIRLYVTINIHRKYF